MATLLGVILGTSYLCHAIAHVSLNKRARRALEVATLLGAILGAIGYYGEALTNFNEQFLPMIPHSVELGSDAAWESRWLAEQYP